MKINKFGEQIFDSGDICELLYQGIDWAIFKNMKVENVNLDTVNEIVESGPNLGFVLYNEKDPTMELSLEAFDKTKQSIWFMPDEYKNKDIAQHVLSLCGTDAEIQRCGKELLLFQEFGLFNLLRYLNYLVDTMQKNQIIWGVGRGSSVASYVLYLLGVHKVNSIYYDLDPSEFLHN